MSPEPDGLAAGARAPAGDESPAALLLPVVLGLIAGNADTIGFLGLGGLFTAHVTSNLVVLAAHLVTGGSARVAPMLAVPVFMMALALARLLASTLESAGAPALRPLLLLEFLLLVAFLGLGVAAGPHPSLDAAGTVLAGMLGVSAMGVQNALVQISLPGVPSTAAMTTNLTRLTVDVGAVLLERNAGAVATARRRAQRAWPVIAGFAAGCGMGATCEAAAGLWALALPAGLALLALGIGVETERAGARR